MANTQLTREQIEALARYAVGVGSEGGIAPGLSLPGWSYKFDANGNAVAPQYLTINGKTVNDVSGYSIGILQTDFGQRHAKTYATAFQNFLVDFETSPQAEGLTAEELLTAIPKALMMQKPAMIANPASMLNDQEFSALNSFLLTPEGVTESNSFDQAIINSLTSQGLQAANLVANSGGDLRAQQEAATIAMKLQNQAPDLVEHFTFYLQDAASNDHPINADDISIWIDNEPALTALTAGGVSNANRVANTFLELQSSENPLIQAVYNDIVDNSAAAPSLLDDSDGLYDLGLKLLTSPSSVSKILSAFGGSGYGGTGGTKIGQDGSIPLGSSGTIIDSSGNVLIWNKDGTAFVIKGDQSIPLSGIDAIHRQDTASFSATLKDGSSLYFSAPNLGGHCFPANTMVSQADGATKQISEIQVGERVLAFDESANNLNPPLSLARIRRLYRGITDEWLLLSNGVSVTPGHRFLNEHGGFERIDELVARGGSIVSAEGALLSVTAERIIYSEVTRHLYEEAEEEIYETTGNLALKPRTQLGWRTYNLEVEGLHTYIAGGIRVHNDSLGDTLLAEEEFQNIYGVAFDPQSQADRDQLAQDIKNNVIDGGALTNSIGPDGDTTALEDRLDGDNDRIASQIADANGDTTFVDSYGDQIEVNSSRQEVSEIIPDGQGGTTTISYGYAADGSQYVASQVDRNSTGQVTTNIANTADASSGAVTLSDDVTYNGSGGRVSDVTTDTNGNILNEIDYGADGSTVASRQQSSYDASGNLLSSSEVDYNSSGQQTDAFTTDGDGNLTSYHDNASDGSATQYDYNSDGSYNVSTFDKSGDLVSQQEYNSDDILTSEKDYINGSLGESTAFDGTTGNLTQSTQYDPTTGSVISSQNVNYDGNGVEVDETITGSISPDHDVSGVIAGDSGELSGSEGINSGDLINDFNLQGGGGDTSQLFSDVNSPTSPILVWDLNPSSANSPVAASETPFDDFTTSSDDPASDSGSSSYKPIYETSPGSDPSGGSSPLGSGSLTLPSQSETNGEQFDDFVSELNNVYTGNVYIISPTDQVLTPQQYEALDPTDQVYTAYFSDSANDEYYPMFELESAMNNVLSMSGDVDSYLNNSSNPSASYDGIIESTYQDIVEPYAGTYDGPSNPSDAGAYESPIFSFVTESMADDESGLYDAVLDGPDYFTDYFDDSGSYSDSPDYDYSTVFSYSEDDSGYDYSSSDDEDWGDVGGDSGDFGFDDSSFYDDFGFDFPLVLNLSGKQVHTVSAQASNVHFNVTGNGANVPTGWITSDEGFLVLDPNGENITSGAQWIPSFGFLQQYDVNHNGVLTAREADAAGIKVWIDKNSDGVTEPGELYTLGALGIASINLKSTITGAYDNGNFIANDSTFTWSSGGTGDIADTYLMNGATSVGDRAYKTSGSTTTIAADGTVTEILTGSNISIDMAASGVNSVIDQGSSDVIAAGNASGVTIVGGTNSILEASSAAKATITGGIDSKIYGGSGTDFLIARYDGTVITTGTGSNTVEVDSDDNTINASAGTATIILDGTSNTVLFGTNAAAKINVNDSGNTINGSDAAIVVADKVVATITGNDDRVSEGGFAALTVNGSGATVDITGSSSLASLSGGSVSLEANVSDATVRGNSDAVTIFGSSVSLALEGAGDTATIANGSVTLGSGSSVTINGDFNTISEVGGDTVTSTASNDDVEVSGTGNAVTVLGGTITLQSGAGLTLTGNAASVSEQGSNTLTVNGSGDVLDVAGTGNRATVSNASITVENSSAVTISGNANAIAVLGNATITATGTGDTLDVYFGGNDITVGNADVTIEEFSSATLRGNSLTTTVAGNDTVVFTGSGALVDIGGAGNALTVTGGTLALEQSASVSIAGNSDAITELGSATISSTGTGDSLIVSGTGNVATLTGGQVTVQNGGGVTLHGNNFAITEQGNASVVTSGTGETLDVQGAGNTATIGNGVVTLEAGGALSLTGNSDAITELGSATISSTGTGDSLIVSGTGNVATLIGGPVTVQNGSGVTLYGDNFTITEQGNGSVITSGIGETLDVQGAGNTATIGNGVVTLEAGGALSLTGNSDAITELGSATISSTGTGDSLIVSGTGNVATLTGGQVTVQNGGGVTLHGNNFAITEQGNASVVTSGTGETLDVQGAGNTATIGNGVVTLEAGGALSLTGNSDAITELGNATISSAGTGDSLIVSGTGNVATLIGGPVTVQNGSGVTLYGDNFTITEQGNGSVITSGIGETLDVQGAGNTATIGNGVVTLEAGGALSLTGNSDAITELGSATISSTGTGDSLIVSGTGNVA
ncbi:hypothetical protein FHT86_007178, partial [Rhizobium sp. BK313]|uniref:hypothetical protein n=1 Tax=Rhizobium sp. BK313 TaxID=2587081 RepID=UPI00161F293C